jgi:hypothetical protein
MQLQMKREEMALQERHTRMQYEKDMQLAQQQQADDMARAEIEARDKQQQHELAQRKLALDAEEAVRRAELDHLKLQIEATKLELEQRRVAKDIEETDTRIAGEQDKVRAVVEKDDSAKMVTDNLAQLVEGVKSASDMNSKAVSQAVLTMTQAVEQLSKPRKTVKKIVRGPDGRAEGVEEVG